MKNKMLKKITVTAIVLAMMISIISLIAIPIFAATDTEILDEVFLGYSAGIDDVDGNDIDYEVSEIYGENLSTDGHRDYLLAEATNTVKNSDGTHSNPVSTDAIAKMQIKVVKTA